MISIDPPPTPPSAYTYVVADCARQVSKVGIVTFRHTPPTMETTHKVQRSLRNAGAYFLSDYSKRSPHQDKSA